MDRHAFPPPRFQLRAQAACDTVASNQSTASQWARSLTSKIEGVHIAPSPYLVSDPHPHPVNRLKGLPERHPSALIPGYRRPQTIVQSAIPHFTTPIYSTVKEQDTFGENLLASWPWHVERILQESQHMSFEQYAQWIREHYGIARLGALKHINPAQLAASRAMDRAEIGQDTSPQPILQKHFARYDPTKVSFADDRAHQIASAVYRAFQRFEVSEMRYLPESSMTQLHHRGTNVQSLGPRLGTERAGPFSRGRDVRVVREPSIWSLLCLCFKKPEVMPALAPSPNGQRFHHMHKSDRLQHHTTPEDLGRLRTVKKSNARWS